MQKDMNMYDYDVSQPIPGDLVNTSIPKNLYNTLVDL